MVHQCLLRHLLNLFLSLDILMVIRYRFDSLDKNPSQESSYDSNFMDIWKVCRLFMYFWKAALSTTILLTTFYGLRKRGEEHQG